ncbi:MAG: type II toxin-antitoxin system Phd/YefM family antitoxin [Pseudomonadota bacterium]
MIVRSISSQEFDANVAEVLRLAVDGPVFITDQGEPAYVLLSFEEYTRLVDGDRRAEASGSSSARDK